MKFLWLKAAGDGWGSWTAKVSTGTAPSRWTLKRRLRDLIRSNVRLNANHRSSTIFYCTLSFCHSLHENPVIRKKLKWKKDVTTQKDMFLKYQLRFVDESWKCVSFVCSFTLMLSYSGVFLSSCQMNHLKGSSFFCLGWQLLPVVKSEGGTKISWTDSLFYVVKLQFYRHKHNHCIYSIG